jgi:hypothetical protein
VLKLPPSKALRRKFGFWILCGVVGFFVLLALGQWRLSFCKPPHNVRAASSYEYSTQDYRRSEIFIPVTSSDQKAAGNKGNPQGDDRYYLPEILCGEIKFTDLLIALFTYYLVIVGWFTMRSADENTKNAERAYLVAGSLFGIPKEIPADELGKWKMKNRAEKGMFNGPWQLAISNFGRTVAISTKVEWGLCPKDVFLEAIKDFDDTNAVSSLLDSPKPEHIDWRSKHMKETSVTQNIFAPTTEPYHYRQVEVTERKIGWVVFGRLTYKDVFKDTHYTTFAFHLTDQHAEAVGKSLSDDHS